MHVVDTVLLPSDVMLPNNSTGAASTAAASPLVVLLSAALAALALLGFSA